ncbi:hypothetical protein [Thermoflavimicrobium daqui]|uniref:Uncharacterized protein n=1 Tax=Thermoflavimicrobium daqui TaxID=2137476 RepID=A0A364K8K3_9BACL|nr:hypothetical protein [Thermoflavimicrobium daqui]RAL26627.1 hypothetical protein DL897_00835 [Thermoflavimicrobium daqui]
MSKGTPNEQLLARLNKKLLRYHRHLGLNHQQYVLLNTFIQYDDIEVIEDITGFKEEKIIAMLEEMMKSHLIDLNEENEVDLDHLYSRLERIEKEMTPIRDLLVQEYKKFYEQPEKRTYGLVELIPMTKGIGVRLQDGTMMSLKHVRELSKELLIFAQSTTDEDIKQMNLRFSKEKEQGKEKK